MSFRSRVFSVLAGLAAAGGVLLVWSDHIQPWKDPDKANGLRSAMPSQALGTEAYHTYNARIFEQLEFLRTDKWQFFDAGSCLIALAASLALALVLLRIRHWQDVVNLQTPRHRIVILGVCMIAWFWWCRSVMEQLQQDLDREKFLPWADTIGIPMVGIGLVLFGGLIILTPLTWFLALRRAKLPVSLWIWRDDAPVASWFFSLCAAFAVLCGVQYLWEVFHYGPYIGAPAVPLWIYGALAVRAAALSQPWGAKPAMASTIMPSISGDFRQS
jgi:hypothetical protein